VKIHIDIRDDIDPVDALTRVKHVISEGRVSRDGKYYCYLTTWKDGVHVAINIYRKSDCFVVYKSKT
jgi:hypothetical protein